ncbi:MAG: phosphoglucomutase/phosphomannomutase family protein, partial [Chloroflexota bacterium]
MTIKFGTDGWRAVISDTFTFENLRKVSQATADYLLEQADEGQALSVVIGFDTRFLSDRYALEVARVMAANNITAWLTRADSPTPAISYNVVHKQANMGVMITASHNPPRYNGFKLKTHYGGAATKNQTQAVAVHLEKIEAEQKTPKLISYDEALKKERIFRFDPAWTYYDHLTSKLIDLDIISLGELNVIADGMFGSGRGAFSEVLSRTRTRVTNIRAEMNPGFGGIHPEPMQKYLRELIATVRNANADIGLV